MQARAKNECSGISIAAAIRSRIRANGLDTAEITFEGVWHHGMVF